MKKLTSSQIKQHIVNQLMRQYTKDNRYPKTIAPNAVMVTGQILKDEYYKFPVNLLSYMDIVGDQKRYLLPQMFYSLYGKIFDKDNYSSFSTEFLNTLIEKTKVWNKLANEEMASQYDDEISEKRKKKLEQLSLEIATFIYEALYTNDIVSEVLWKSIGDYDNSSSVSAASTSFSSLFETAEDITEFEKNVISYIYPKKNKAIHKLSDDATKLISQTYIKAFKNFKDYTLPFESVHDFVFSYLYSDHETYSLQGLHCITKYRFELYQQQLVELYNTSNKPKLVNTIKTILEEHNCLPHHQDNNLFIEESCTQEILYHKHLKLNFLSLKSKLSHDHVFAETLIYIVVSQLEQLCKHIRYTLEDHNKTVTIKVTSSDSEFNDNFKNIFFESIDVALSDIFLNSAFSSQQNVMQRLKEHPKNKLNYESLYKIKELFASSLEKYRFIHKLDKELIVHNVNNQKNKI